MRTEKDALGAMELPDNAYYGIQTVRGRENFDVSPKTFNDYPNVVKAYAEIKKACAFANRDIEALSPDKAEAIAKACDEIIAGKFAGQFPVNVFRGCGTSANMNMNEVIANRANEILTGKKGYNLIHPNTHVNMCQSSNDIFPTVESVVLYREVGALLEAVPLLEKALEIKSKEFADVVKIGRTSLQDALPITLGQAFSGYVAAVRRNRLLLEGYRDTFRSTILGGTAVGTGMGVMPGFIDKVYMYMSEFVGFPVHCHENLVDGMKNADHFIILSAYVKAIAIMVGKIANDFRQLASGPRGGFGELILPEMDEGDAGIPEKTAPDVLDLMVQMMHQVCANDWGVSLSVPTGETDIMPSAVINFMGTLESMEILTSGIKLFTRHCVEGLKADVETCRRSAEKSTSLATMVSALFGYEIGSKIAKISYEEGITCKEAALREKLLPPDVAEELFDIKRLTELEYTVAMFAKYKTIRNVN